MEVSLRNVLLLMLIAILSGVLQSYFSPFTIDDAYITFTYSKNAALGNGFVFSRGEYVEATSSFLWAFILVPFEWLGIGATIGSKILGVSFFYLSLYFSYRLCERVVPREIKARWKFSPGLLGALIAGTSGSFAAWSIQGMENGMVGFLIVWSLYLFLREVEEKGGYSSFLPLVLLEMSRPEGFIYWGVLLVFRVLYFIVLKGIPRSWLTHWIVGLFGSLLAYESWGFYYYGTFLPNTVGAKVGGISWGRMKEGLAYLFSFSCGQLTAMSVLILCLAAVFLILVIRGRLKGSLALNPLAISMAPALALLIVQLAFVTATGGDWMPFGRFMGHISPVLAVLFVVVWAAIDERFFRSSGESITLKHTVWSVGALIITLGYIALGVRCTYNEYLISMWINGNSERAIVPLLDYVNKVAGPDDLLAASDVGRLGYFYKGKIFDWWGLASPEVVKLGQAMGHIQPKTVLSKNPRFIVLYSGTPNLLDPGGVTYFGGMSAPFLNDEAFMSRYKQVFSSKFTDGRYHVVFERVS